MSDALEIGEPHPASSSAYKFILKYLAMNSYIVEALASTAIDGTRVAEICYGTINRILNKEPVSDRDVLGLAWILKEWEEEWEETEQC